VELDGEPPNQALQQTPPHVALLQSNRLDGGGAAELGR